MVQHNPKIYFHRVSVTASVSEARAMSFLARTGGTDPEQTLWKCALGFKIGIKVGQVVVACCKGKGNTSCQNARAGQNSERRVLQIPVISDHLLLGSSEPHPHPQSFPGLIPVSRFTRRHATALRVFGAHTSQHPPSGNASPFQQELKRENEQNPFQCLAAPP